MRELKFRVWDNLEKRMRKVVSLHWQGDKLVSARLEGENEPIPIEGRLVIEQSTGLKDEHGVEIYGGDIVQTPEYPGKIVYNKKYACFELWRPRSSDCFIALTHQQDIDMGDLEVVGNIHKNPELIGEDDA